MEISRKCGKQRGRSSPAEKTEMEKGQERDKHSQNAGDWSARSYTGPVWMQRPDSLSLSSLLPLRGQQLLRPQIAEIPHHVFICVLPLGSPSRPGQAERRADNLHRHRLAHCHWRLAKYELIQTRWETQNTNSFLSSPRLHRMSSV